MTNKIFLCILLCIVLFNIIGCSEATTPLPTDDVSTVSPMQSAENSFKPSSTEPVENTFKPSSTESAENSFKPSSTESVGDSLTPTQSEKTINSGDNNVEDAYKLIVNGKEIAVSDNIKLNYEYHYAELPLTAIMKELGAKVEWQSKTTAKITLGEKGYLLDTTKGSLIEIGNTFNIITVAPGTKHGVFYRVVDNEFIIDSDSAKLLLINIMGAKMSVDYDHRIVNINTIDNK